MILIPSRKSRTRKNTKIGTGESTITTYDQDTGGQDQGSFSVTENTGIGMGDAFAEGRVRYG